MPHVVKQWWNTRGWVTCSAELTVVVKSVMTNCSLSYDCQKTPERKTSMSHMIFFFVDLMTALELHWHCLQIEKTFEESRIHINWYNSVWNLNQWEKLEEEIKILLDTEETHFYGFTWQVLLYAYYLLGMALFTEKNYFLHIIGMG